MFGFRTPAKQSETAIEISPPIKTATQASNVRRSIDKIEATESDRSPKSQTGPKTKKAETKSKVDDRTPPPKLKLKISTKYSTKTAEARACLNKAKLHLNDSRNLRTDIKNEVTQAIDRLYAIVKELEEEKKLINNETREVKNSNNEQKGSMESDIMEKIDLHTKMLQENNRKIEDLKMAIEEQKITYADVASSKPSRPPMERNTLHSLVVTSKEDTDTGEDVLSKVREAVDAKEGWVKVARVRKGKDRKIIMSCGTRDERDKVRERLEKNGKHLVVEDVKNKDPLIVLKDVLLINSDDDVLRAMRNQNQSVFQGLEGEDSRVQIKYRRRARNPHTGHIVVSTSPKLWQRMVDIGLLHIDLQQIRVADQSPLVQCSRCLGYGHSKRFCTEAVDLCSHCGGPHLGKDCADRLAGAPPSCRNCSKAELARVEHNAFSGDCPVRKRWDAIARSAVSYC